MSESDHVWQITTTPVSEADGRFVFELDWKRYAQGTLAKPGAITIELATSRRDTIERRGSGPTIGIPGGMGRKVLLLRPGEAVEIEIPVGGGTMGSRVREQPVGGSTSTVSGGLRGGTGSAAAAPTEPVLLRGNSYVVNFRPFFEGHRVSLIVQAKRQE